MDKTEPPQRDPMASFRMPVMDKYKDMGTVVMGKSESGVVQVSADTNASCSYSGRADVLAAPCTCFADVMCGRQHPACEADGTAEMNTSSVVTTSSEMTARSCAAHAAIICAIAAPAAVSFDDRLLTQPSGVSGMLKIDTAERSAPAEWQLPGA
jgi:hypothetical protein